MNESVPLEWSKTHGTEAAGHSEVGSRGHLRQIADLARSVSRVFELEAILRSVTDAIAALRSDIGCVIRLVDPELSGYRLVTKGGTAGEGFSPLVPFGAGMTDAVAAKFARCSILCRGRWLDLLDRRVGLRTPG